MALDVIFANINQDQIKKYTDYWSSIVPVSDREILQRWLFAFMSIRTTWTNNVRGYNAIKDYEDWIDNQDVLLMKLIESKCGMHNKRADILWKFAQDFLNNPEQFKKSESESWTTLRDKLVKRCKGIGIAKVSFTLEMCFPIEAEVVCLDTHMMKLYDMTNKRENYIKYLQSELDWIHRSKQLGTSPCITRAIYWDSIQKQQDSRYWSHVLEG